MVDTQQAAIIEQIHDLFAYPEQAAGFMDELAKAFPEAARWIEERMGAAHDEKVVVARAAIPRTFAELPSVSWMWKAEEIEPMPGDERRLTPIETAGEELAG